MNRTKVRKMEEYNNEVIKIGKERKRIKNELEKLENINLDTKNKKNGKKIQKRQELRRNEGRKR